MDPAAEIAAQVNDLTWTVLVGATAAAWIAFEVRGLRGSNDDTFTRWFQRLPAVIRWPALAAWVGFSVWLPLHLTVL